MENDLLTSDIRGQRTLATVVFTDCVGFSARMSVDEDHTLDLIRRDLQFMKQVCKQFEGRVLKSTGDGLLMCFISAVKAVECAVKIQKTLTDSAADLPPEDALEHRIGIHLADMFISTTDVMGNGVNIAARLQTEADPGGICISQTVYDVVKAGLHLETVYLGPRELKNIREVVPAYKVLLSPAGAATNQPMVATRNLEHSRNLLRIKKLIFYVCKNVWESDQTTLNSLDLSELIQELLGLAPTPERIRFYLDAAVKTLSKPDEYSLIAGIIFREVSKLCPNDSHPADLNQVDSEDSQTVVENKRSPQTEPDLYERIATELEQTEDLVRTKKLAFYVCRRRWENDLDRVAALRTKDLIAELHQLAPTFEQLRSTVNEFVRTLSKQAEYSLIGNALVSKLQRLYVSETPSSSAHHLLNHQDNLLQTPSPSPLQPSQSQVYRQIVSQLQQEPDLSRIKKLMLYVCRQQWEGNSARLNALNLEDLVQEVYQLAQTAEQLDSALRAAVKTLNKQEEYTAIAQIIANQLGQAYLDYPESLPAKVIPDLKHNLPEPLLTSDNPEQSQPPELPNLFDYRLGIMKYANPLRAKILIFSALHYDFSFSTQDWLNLKLHELDSLLRQLLGSCKSYTDMEVLLYRAARRLKEPEENIKTADAVIQCLRSFYLYGGANVLFGSSAEKTQISLDDFEENTVEFANPAEDDDCTCQLLPSAPSSTSAGGRSLAQSGSTHLLPDKPLSDRSTAEATIYPPS